MWTVVEHEGKRYRLAVAKTQAGVWVGWPGGSTLVTKRAAFATEGLSDDRITAPMTGKVVQVRVRPGDNVEVDDVLVVLEAMKMEYRLTAPRAGKVDAVYCEEGQLCDLGRILVLLSSP